MRGRRVKTLLSAISTISVALTSSSKHEAALWEAARAHDVARVRQCLQDTHTGAVNEMHSTRGTTPLMAACQTRDKGHKDARRSALEVVQLLVEHGASATLAAHADAHNTALHYAAQSNQARTIEYLLREGGADAFALNALGHTPLDVARWIRSRDAEDVLTEHVRVQSGWLWMRKKSLLGLRRWKKRLCVALACSRDRNVVEIMVYKERAGRHPKQVLALRGGLHSIVALSKEVWLDREYMFELTRPVVSHRGSRKVFARNRSTHERPKGDDSTVVELQFAADTLRERDEWLTILQRGPIPLGGVSASATAAANGMPPVAPWQGLFPVGAAAAPAATGSSSTSVVMTSLSSSTGSTQAASGYGASQEEDARLVSVSCGANYAVLPPTTYETLSTSPSAPSFDESGGSTLSNTPARPTAPVKSLMGEDVSSSQGVGAAASREECVICMDKPRNAICAPCGHVAGCFSCLYKHTQAEHVCPICRAHVASVVKIYDC